MAETNLYTYGVTESSDEEFDVSGIDGAELAYPVTHRSLSAIVSDVGTMEPERTDENLRAHDEVLRDVMLDGERTVVPMQFGMVFKNERTLKNVLRNGRRAFTKALRDTDGMFELGVKIIADEGADLDREAIVADASERLRAESESEAENGDYSDRLVFNRSYLLARDDRADFEAAVDEIIDAYSENATVQYTGPWAPYDFVDIEIGASR